MKRHRKLSRITETDHDSPDVNILLLNHTWFSIMLRKRGHTVLSAGIYGKELDINIEQPELSVDALWQLLPPGFTPDRIVYHDDSGVPWLTGLEKLDIPKVFYSVDTHHHYGWHGHFATLFDHVLVAQKKYLPFIANYNPQTTWFPPWATRPFEPSAEKSIDVCFRGTLDANLNPRRMAFFENLSRLVPGDYGPGDYTLSYPHAKVVINQIVADDLNFRVFEALMAGALLVTPAESTGLTDLFTPGEDLLVYPSDNVEAAAQAIRWALANESERARIAGNGRKKLLAAHTRQHRALELEQLLDGLRCTARSHPLLHFSAAQSYLFSTLVSELQNLGLRRGLLRAAGENLLESFQKNEPVEGVLSIATTLHLCAKLRQSGETDYEVPIFTALQNKISARRVAGLGLIDALLFAGRKDDARKLAELYNPGNPDALLTQALNLMEQTRKEMLEAELIQAKGGQ